MANTPDKRIIIDGKTIGNGTGVKGSRNTSSSDTPTFDGVITAGTKNVSYDLEINRIAYENQVTYQEIDMIVEKSLDTPVEITIKEVKRVPGETPFVIVRDYHDCILDGDDYEIKPEEHTVENLKYKCASMDKSYEPVDE
ncbi:hypothetical protein [Methanobrevibacter sp.]